MSWIGCINEDEAKGELKTIYDHIKMKRGKLSNVMRMHSLNPKVMEKHMELYLSIMFGKSDLTRKDREMIAVVVSSINKCEYCVKHHGIALDYYWKDKEQLEKLIKDFNTVDLSEKQLVMLEFVYQLTKKPYNITKKDIEELRNNEFSDSAILDITLIVSYFNFVNRIVLGLGVEYSENEFKGYMY
jgi:uncharacterized peroxidase-related enzyme